MKEREEFAEDLAAAGVDFLDLANGMHERGGAGDAWFGAMGFLVLQLSELVAGNHRPIDLTPAEMKVAVRAFTNISRTFKILRGTKYNLLSAEDWKLVEPFGNMLTKIWSQIPGQQTVRDNLPGIVDPNHPAWRKEKKNGKADT